MSYSADAIANEFLDIAEKANVPVSPMKLQKLVYYSHGWHLALTRTPLISEPIQAWKYGPVIQSLYREFKEFGNNPITRRAMDARWGANSELELYAPSVDQETEDPKERQFVHALAGRVWELYGKYTPSQLSQMTHMEGSPWHQVASHIDLSVQRGINIPNELIEQHFRSRLEQVQQ